MVFNRLGKLNSTRGSVLGRIAARRAHQLGRAAASHVVYGLGSQAAQAAGGALGSGVLGAAVGAGLQRGVEMVADRVATGGSVRSKIERHRNEGTVLRSQGQHRRLANYHGTMNPY